MTSQDIGLDILVHQFFFHSPNAADIFSFLCGIIIRGQVACHKHINKTYGFLHIVGSH